MLCNGMASSIQGVKISVFLTAETRINAVTSLCRTTKHIDLLQHIPFSALVCLSISFGSTLEPVIRRDQRELVLLSSHGETSVLREEKKSKTLLGLIFGLR